MNLMLGVQPSLDSGAETGFLEGKKVLYFPKGKLDKVQTKDAEISRAKTKSLPTAGTSDWQVTKVTSRKQVV